LKIGLEVPKASGKLEKKLLLSSIKLCLPAHYVLTLSNS